MSAIKVIGLSGSLRKDSYNTKLLHAFIASAPADVTVHIFDISKLPFVNEDFEADLPEEVQKLQQLVHDTDAALFCTPEYNRSYSPVLKNAIDWGSRPEGHNAWDGMPATIVGATPYNLGTFGAQQHLRQVLMYLNMPPLQQPEFYLEQADDKFDGTGKLTDEHTQEKIDEVWVAFVELIKKHRG